MEGLIFNVQRYSIHDGPGIRTVVFLKGCPLGCLWCSNPESQHNEQELMFFADKCRSCGRCVSVCPHGARLMEKAVMVLDRGNCRACGRCVNVCDNAAMRIVGRRVAVEEILRVVEQDRAFYDQSGGGVTVSGGEPAAQPDFTASVLAACREHAIDAAVETAGASPWPDLARVIEQADLVLYDIKHLDRSAHLELTGAPNDLILANAARAAGCGKKMIVRVPLIPGYNDDPQHLRALARFVTDLGTVSQVDLLPYHEYGSAKYGRLGRRYALANLGGLEAEGERVAEAVKLLQGAGLVVQVGG